MIIPQSWYVFVKTRLRLIIHFIVISFQPQKAIKSSGQTSEIDEVVTALRGTFNNAVQCKNRLYLI